MITVLIVDDSAFMRKMISLIVESDSELSVVGVAKNGVEAIDLAQRLNPDVITLDVEMPEMDGITALKEIVKKAPDSKVIMLSALTKEGGKLTMDALESGAVDFVTKPSGTISLDIMKEKQAIVQKIKEAHASTRIHFDISKFKKEAKEEQFHFSRRKEKAVVIISSTGGPATLERIVPLIDQGIPAPIFIVQHMPAGFTQAFASRLNVLSHIPVKEAVDGEEVKKGVVYIAPGGFHMIVKRLVVDGQEKEFITLSLDPPIFGLRPYGDYTISSVVEIYKDRTICVILTGMGSDGTDGAKLVKKNNGKVFAEDEQDCVIYGMPKSAVDAGLVDEKLRLSTIATKIMGAVDE